MIIKSFYLFLLLLLVFNLNADNENVSNDKGNFSYLKRNIEIGNIIFINSEVEADRKALKYKDHTGRTLLMYVFENIKKGYSLDNLETLISKGYDLTLTDDEGRGTLYYFITAYKYNSSNALEAFKYMMEQEGFVKLIFKGDVCEKENGKQKNKECVEGKTPMMYAAETGYIELVKMLEQVCKDNENDCDIGKLFKISTKEGSNALAFAVEAAVAVQLNKIDSYIKVIDYLHEKGCSFKNKKTNLTILMIAARNNLPESILKKILDIGCDIDAQDKDKKTAIMYAAIERNESTVEFLVGKGANLLLKSKKNWTVKDYVQDKLAKAHYEYMSIEGTKTRIIKAKANYKKWKKFFKYIKKEYKKQEKENKK
jgi:ankyrin repeat protein